MKSFWEDKDPCWELKECPEYVRNECPAYVNPERPCWEVARTQSEILIKIKKDCRRCGVYNLYAKSANRRKAKTDLLFVRSFD